MTNITDLTTFNTYFYIQLTLDSLSYFFTCYIQKQKMMLSDFDLKKCINCGLQPTGPYISLKEDNIIDNMCLAQIQTLSQQKDIDEAISSVYKYILSLVLKCKKCNVTLDGAFKINASRDGNNPYCKDCIGFARPKAMKIEKKPTKAQCVQCQNVLEGIHILNALQLEGIYICKGCLDVQSQEKKEVIAENKFKKYKPQRKIELNHQRSGPLFPIPGKYQIQKNPVESNPAPLKQIKKNSLIMIEPKFLKILQPLKLQKKQMLKCQFCQQMLSIDKFSQIHEGLFICIICKDEVNKLEKNYESKKERKTQVEGDLGLAELFKETPIEQKKKQEKKIEPLQQMNSKVVKSTLYSLKQCKLCFNAQSNMINIKCRHLMMCQPCHKNYKLKNNNKEDLPCPVCTAVGRYQMYIVPIYT